MNKQQQTEQDVYESDDERLDAIEGEVEVLESSSPRRSNGLLPLVLASLALLIVFGALFLGYRYWVDLKANLSNLDQSLSQAIQQQTQLAQKLQQARENFDRQKQEIATQRDELKQQAERIREEKEASKQQSTQLYRSMSDLQTRLGASEGQWRVAEAEYLIRVANHRLNLMGDPVTAREALKSADERLSATADPAWNGVREVLAREMTQLKAVPNVDTAGISAELTALSEQVDQLPLLEDGVVRLASAEEEPVESSETGEADSQNDLMRILDDFWQGFKSMMVVRHHDHPVTAMLPPEQRYFLLQNLKLKLETAKAALMGRNPQLYQDNLDAARQWVNDYFQPTDPRVQGYITQLQALAGRDVAPAFPDISGSLRALQARRQSLSMEAPQ
ncbi:MAG: uroporphyrinogen-III C-methyltransferase [Candidatus Thiodiazotropha sp.]